MSYVAMSSSVFGSITRTCGGAPSDGQTLTMYPREWNVSDPHSAGGIASLKAAGELPSGPAQPYESVIHVSLWMLLRGFGAMNGLRGARVCRSLSGPAGAPWNLGNSGASGSTMGSAVAPGASASSSPADATTTPAMRIGRTYRASGWAAPAAHPCSSSQPPWPDAAVDCRLDGARRACL